MKNKMRSVLVLTIVMSFTNLSLAQEKTEPPVYKKNAVGIEYNVAGWSIESFNFNYRYYLKKFNLKGGIELMSPNNYDNGDYRQSGFWERYNQPKLVSNIDATGKFYGLDDNYYQRESYVKFKIGAEKVFLPSSKINILIGADLYLGIYKRTGKSSVNHYQLDSVENHSFWKNNYDKFGKFLSEENIKTTEQKNMIIGAELTAGLILNISKRFFATTTINYNLPSSVSQKITNTYENSKFENDFSSSYYDIAYFSRNLGASVGLNYRF